MNYRPLRQGYIPIDREIEDILKDDLASAELYKYVAEDDENVAICGIDVSTIAPFQ